MAGGVAGCHERRHAARRGWRARGARGPRAHSMHSRAATPIDARASPVMVNDGPETGPVPNTLVAPSVARTRAYADRCPSNRVSTCSVPRMAAPSSSQSDAPPAPDGSPARKPASRVTAGIVSRISVLPAMPEKHGAGVLERQCLHQVPRAAAAELVPLGGGGNQPRSTQRGHLGDNLDDREPDGRARGGSPGQEPETISALERQRNWRT